MEQKRFQRFTGMIILFAGAILMASSFSGITGFTVLEESLSKTEGGIIGFLFFVVGLLLLLIEGEESKKREKVGGLEATTQKLFYTDKKGIVRINDFAGNLSSKGSYQGEPADKALKELEDEYKSKEEKELLQETFAPEYVPAARRQRDSCTAPRIPEHSEFAAADRFLKDWDPNYTPFKNPFLRPGEYSTHLNPSSGVYDTRDIINVMESNIPGFTVELMTSHDVTVSYDGERFNIFAGSSNPYETDKSQINHAITRIAESDLKRSRIQENELSERIEVLKKAIFGHEEDNDEED